MTLLSSHDDPQAAADFLLCDLEDQLDALGAIAPEARAQFRDRIADVADRLRTQAINLPRENR